MSFLRGFSDWAVMRHAWPVLALLGVMAAGSVYTGIQSHQTRLAIQDVEPRIDRMTVEMELRPGLVIRPSVERRPGESDGSMSRRLDTMIEALVEELQ